MCHDVDIKYESSQVGFTAASKTQKDLQSGGEPYNASSVGRFLQKSPIIIGSFAKRDLQLKTPKINRGVAKPTVLHLERPSSAKEPYNQWLFCGKRPAT